MNLYKSLNELIKPDRLRHKFKNNLKYFFDLKDSVSEMMDSIIDCSKIALVLDQDIHRENKVSPTAKLDEILEKVGEDDDLNEHIINGLKALPEDTNKLRLTVFRQKLKIQCLKLKN